MIKEADKGSAVVARDKGDYVTEAVQQLSDRRVYEEIEVDPTQVLSNAVNDILQHLREKDPGIKEVAGYFEVSDSRLSGFHLLSKIHKGLTSVKGRPVISNCVTMTERMSELLDHHLDPLVSFSRSYIKDINHFLARLTEIGSIPEGGLSLQLMWWAFILVFPTARVLVPLGKPWVGGEIQLWLLVPFLGCQLWSLATTILNLIIGYIGRS